MNDLRMYADYNREFLTAMKDAKKAGKSVDDVVNAWKVPAKYTGFPTPQPAGLRRNVQVMFDELK